LEIVHGSFSRTPFLFIRLAAHRSGCRTIFPGFITVEYWPLGSMNLNPLDYKLWTILEACAKSHHNLESLKKALVKAAREIPMEVFGAIIAEWPNSLKVCV